MTNKQIAQQFKSLAQLMELHEENSYKIRSYSSAYRIFRAATEPVYEMNLTQVKQLKGIGDAIGNKVQELRLNGEMKIMKGYLEKTPKGIVELLKIKGLGIGKIKTLWLQMGIQSPGELLYACNENRLITVKGFGTKTQSNIKQQLEYYFLSIDKFHYARLEEEAENIILDIQEVLDTELISLTGDIRRLMPVLTSIEILLGSNDVKKLEEEDILTIEEEKNGIWKCKTIENDFPVIIYSCNPDYWGYQLLRTTGNETFLKDFFEVFYPEKIDWKKNPTPESLKGISEEELFEKADLPFIPAEIRDVHKILYKIKARSVPQLLEETDIKGVLHAHTTWSDGATSLEELATYVKSLGYEYLGLTDHSQAAFYANGLKADRVLEQFKEVDKLNEKLAPFKILKGIESDILHNGSLDYPEEILKQFDFIIASVHAHLRMDKHTATQRLITAIKNPYTTILGHPTGRLLLSRQGYPIDHEAVIDACAKHNVIIELNANPHRLDLDYTWIPYALEKGVKITINPDAHSLAGVHDIHFGVLAARKGMLTAAECPNTLSLEDFEALLAKKKEAVSA
ncbi:MAG: hypothetical protein GY810_18090 [Aureispira sp.]|nr:hypothetical protein [Aureispira sp.]